MSPASARHTADSVAKPPQVAGKQFINSGYVANGSFLDPGGQLFPARLLVIFTRLHHQTGFRRYARLSVDDLRAAVLESRNAGNHE